MEGKVVREGEVEGKASKLGGSIKRIFSERYVFLAIGYFEPGEGMKIHSHTLPEEIYYVLKGRGEMVLGSERVKLEPGTAVYIPPNIPHGPLNTGDEPLVIAFFHAPPETGEYIVLEEDDH